MCQFRAGHCWPLEHMRHALQKITVQLGTKILLVPGEAARIASAPAGCAGCNLASARVTMHNAGGASCGGFPAFWTLPRHQTSARQRGCVHSLSSNSSLPALHGAARVTVKRLPCQDVQIRSSTGCMFGHAVAYVKYDKASSAAAALESLHEAVLSDGRTKLKVMLAEAPNTRCNINSFSARVAL